MFIYIFRKAKLKMQHQQYHLLISKYLEKTFTRNFQAIILFYACYFGVRPLVDTYMGITICGHLMALVVINASYVNILRFLADPEFHQDIDGWRRWNLRILFGMLIFYGLVNGFFTGLYYYEDIELAIGLGMGSLVVLLSYDDTVGAFSGVRAKVVDFLNRKVFHE